MGLYEELSKAKANHRLGDTKLNLEEIRYRYRLKRRSLKYPIRSCGHLAVLQPRPSRTPCQDSKGKTILRL